MQHGHLKYFGIFKNKDIKGLNHKKRKDLLIKNGIWESRYRIKFPRDGKLVSSNSISDYEIVSVTKEVEEELYAFILKTYEDQISIQFQEFYYLFNEAAYGLEVADKKRWALLQFLHNFRKAYSQVIDFTFEEEVAPGIPMVRNMPKMELMEGKQNALKSNLAESDMLMEFLMGHEAYFKSEAVLDSPIISSLIDFETGYRILRTLNFEYHFEPTKIMTPEDPSALVNNEESFSEEAITDVKVKNSKDDPVEETADVNHDKEEEKVEKPKPAPVFSDEDALAYLMAKVFSKKK